MTSGVEKTADRVPVTSLSARRIRVFPVAVRMTGVPHRVTRVAGVATRIIPQEDSVVPIKTGAGSKTVVSNLTIHPAKANLGIEAARVTKADKITRGAKRVMAAVTGTIEEATKTAVTAGAVMMTVINVRPIKAGAVTRGSGGARIMVRTTTAMTRTSKTTLGVPHTHRMTKTKIRHGGRAITSRKRTIIPAGTKIAMIMSFEGAGPLAKETKTTTNAHRKASFPVADGEASGEWTRNSDAR